MASSNRFLLLTDSFTGLRPIVLLVSIIIIAMILLRIVVMLCRAYVRQLCCTAVVLVLVVAPVDVITFSDTAENK